MNYVDLESILVPEENGKPNPDESNIKNLLLTVILLNSMC